MDKMQMIVRRIVGRRSKITKEEMGAILMGLTEYVNLSNDYVRGTCGDSLAASIAWTQACKDNTCVSVDSRGLRDGQVRYDEPGSMHPLQYSEIMFVSDDIRDADPGSGSTLAYLRQHADRVLVVRKEPDHPAAAEKAKSTVCECDNGHKWSTDNPYRDVQCPTCGDYWV